MKNNGQLLDLGSGNGKLSEPFLKCGYQISLVDSNKDVLMEAQTNFRKINDKEIGFELINKEIENFQFLKKYDGIIIANVLPFQKSKESVFKNLIL